MGTSSKSGKAFVTVVEEAEAQFAALIGLSLPPEKTATLTVLAELLPVEARHRQDLLARHEEAALREFGRGVGSGAIVRSVPAFVYSSLVSLQSMNAEQQDEIVLDPAVFGAIVLETITLNEMHTAFLSANHEALVEGVVGELDEAALRRDLIALRDVAATALASVLPKTRKAAVKAAKGNAETPKSLLVGARKVAKEIDDVLAAGGPEASALRRKRVNPARVARLRDAADRYETASAPTGRRARQVDQVALDMQDGRVLVLVEEVVGAFRMVSRTRGPVVMPALGQLAWVFAGRSGGRSEDDGESGGEDGGER